VKQGRGEPAGISGKGSEQAEAEQGRGQADRLKDAERICGSGAGHGGALRDGTAMRTGVVSGLHQCAAIPSHAAGFVPRLLPCSPKPGLPSPRFGRNATAAKESYIKGVSQANGTIIFRYMHAKMERVRN